jgi:CRISPR type IV-associated protein Csf1
MVAEGEGWRLKDFLTPTFTNHTLAAAPSSDTVCQPCVYLGSGESWRAYCGAHPEMGLKAVHPLSWRSYSHVFAPGVHACPARAEWRRWLLEPPPPPFVFVLTETGKKHVIYRALASYDRDRYWLHHRPVLWPRRNHRHPVRLRNVQHPRLTMARCSRAETPGGVAGEHISPPERT